MPRRTYNNSVIVDPTTNCWLWQGRVDPYGTPITSIHGRTIRVAYAYYAQKHPESSPARLIHTCPERPQQRICVNPDHLTAKQNLFSEVARLKEQLKSDDLSPADREEVQGVIDEMAAIEAELMKGKPKG